MKQSSKFLAKIKPMVSARIIGAAVLWCVLGLLMYGIFYHYRFASQFSYMSLRYNVPINGQAANAARQYAANNSDFWLTFWRQDSALVGNSLQDATVTTIYFSGNASAVFPMMFIEGSAPSSIDNYGVIVSSTLAHRLWGSVDIVGQAVYVDQELRTVRGVFDHGQEIALVSFCIEDRSQSWNAVELAFEGEHAPTRQDAVNFAIHAGLGVPSYVITAAATAVSRFFAWFPIVVVLLIIMVKAFGLLKKMYPQAFVPILIACVIISALFVPFLLEQVPPWLVPTSFSDFSHWSSIMTMAVDALHEFIAAPALLRDIDLALILIYQAIIFAATIVVLGVLATRHNIR